MKKAVFCWSGGKDSALALYRIQQAGEYEVTALLTTLSSTYERVSMHGIEETLLDIQAEAIGLPLTKVIIEEATNTAYEAGMLRALAVFKQQGVHYMIFGDIYLEDIRQYRERMLAHIEMQAVFPLWQSDTRKLINTFVAEGFKTITCCVNEAMLDASFAGKTIDLDFIARLPADVDPCGEHGEYHTFCYDGPIFKKPIPLKVQELVHRKIAYGEAEYSFCYADLRYGAVPEQSAVLY
jgi:uncharacterized protein (TIGR00290 family)